MMFRSFLFVSPLLAAGDCWGDVCSEETAMLQLKSREAPEAQALLQRSQASQTLKTLEENLMGKDGIDRAMCTFYLKSAEGEAMTPCEQLNLLEQTFRDSLQDFRDFDQTMEKTLENVPQAFLAGLANLNNPLAEALAGAQQQWIAGLTAEGVELQKLTATIQAAEEQLGLGSDFTEALASLSTQAQNDFTATVSKIETTIRLMVENVLSLLKGEPSATPATVASLLALDSEQPTMPTMPTMPDPMAGLDGLISSGVDSLLNPSALDARILQKALKEPLEQLKKYLKGEFANFMNTFGGHVAQFWEAVLKLPSTPSDGLSSLTGEQLSDVWGDVDWSDAKDIKKVQKLFWHIAKGYLDAVEHVEDHCTSAGWTKERDFAPRQICKSKDKPSCTDEFLYLMAVDGQGTDATCDAVNSLSRKELEEPLGSGFEQFGICKAPKDVKQACKIIAKAEKKAAKKKSRR